MNEATTTLTRAALNPPWSLAGLGDSLRHVWSNHFN